MNALGLILLGIIAHATAFAAAGMLAYLALRRWGPAAGSLSAGSSLVIMGVVSLLVVGPWPRWWTVDPEALATAVAPVPQIEGSGRSPAEIPGPVRSSETGSEVSTGSDPSASRVEVSARPALWVTVFEELNRELRGHGSDPGRSRWGWPEWLAFGFLASLALGLARLALGLLCLTRLRRQSRPIVDPELGDAVDILRAELGCTRRVELRELTELATPATIGWRRPLLLLPDDWRDWTPAERRAVLAHELAHVHRGDFLAGLVAQLSLALHFYHPLAHWLAARLRLEQELAADAWGARLSGGKPSYLATLARMALRRDGRAGTGPARAFLPSHGTFVRRIEMLRQNKPIENGSLSAAARGVTVGILVGLGLVVAGLRGPAGESPAQAQDPPSARPPAGGGGAPAVAGSFNQAFLPDDAKMILAVRPGTLLRRRDVQSVVDSMRQGPWFKWVQVVPLEDVEEWLVFWSGESPAPKAAGRSPLVPPPSGSVLRMEKPQDWKAVLGQLGPHVGPMQEARHDGQSYLRTSGGDPERWGLYTPDDRTLVLAPETLLRELIEDRDAPPSRHAWDEAWKKTGRGQVMLGLETRWIRRRLAQGVPGGPGAPGQPSDALLKLETFSPLYEKARSYAVSIAASDQGLSFDLVAGSGSEPDARPVAETLQAVLILGKNAVQGIRRELDRQPGTRGEGLEWIFQAAESLLDKARIEMSGSFVSLHATSSVDLAQGIRLLTPAVTNARAAARRIQSVNNLKQIALAFHNYHSTYNHFPAAVNFGGRDRSVPYSWRVAILPFLEHQGLYSQYNFEEPWDGPSNRKLIDKMPAVYSYPGPDGAPSSSTHSSYFVFTGPRTALSMGGPGQGGGAGRAAAIDKRTAPIPPPDREAPAGPAIMNITDGTSNTILAVEAQREIAWTKPEDIPFNPNAPLPEGGGFTPDGFNAVFADGSVRYLKKSINSNVLQALITRDGGEVVRSDAY